MSYALAAAFGTVDPWDHVWAHALGTSDVFVLRLRVSGVKLRDPSDALLFARAAGQGQNLALDVRGIAVWKTADMSADQWMVDVVMTTSALRAAVLWADSAEQMGVKVAADESLRSAFPTLAIQSVVFGQLTDPADSVDHWRSQGMLWDHALPGPKNLGGPTDLMAKPTDYSVVKGQADDGKRTLPWTTPTVPLGPGDKPPSMSTAAVAGLGVGAAFLVWMVSQRGSKHSRHSKGSRRS
jgi:hypothetical protein